MKTLISVTDELILNKIFTSDVLNVLKEFSEISYFKKGDDFIEAIKDCDAVLTHWGSPKIDGHIMDKAKNLKFIGHCAGSVVPYVTDEVFERGLVVVNANGPISKSTAEGAVALIIAACWKLNKYNFMLQNEQWSERYSNMPFGLYKRTLGIIGLGATSREVIRLLKPFDCEILLFSNHCSEADLKELGATLCSLDDLMSRSDVISLHSTLTKNTENMIGEKEFANMRDGAIFVNTARSTIVNTSAMLKHLESGRIHAALDVFDEEPLNSNNILLKLPNVICTPHIAGLSSYWFNMLVPTIIEELRNFSKGLPIGNRIDIDIFNRQTRC